jgi:gluconolactonase
MTLEEIVTPGTELEVLGTGYGFCEGPAADAQGNIYFSDGRKDSIHFYELGRPVRLFVDDSTDANGMMLNSQGELYVCEGAAHRVVAFDVKTKQKRVLASQVDGIQFNEPNDLAIDHQNGFYFTDPNYQHRGQETVMKEDTYYCSPEGQLTRVSTVCVKPNGVLLSPDEKTLYLADSRGEVIYRYDVVGPGKLANETLWIEGLAAHPDGMTLDEQGNLYVCCGRAGLKVYSSRRKPVGVIEVPYASNCCFGGRDFTTLFITSSDKFLGIGMKVRGIRPPCLRGR